MQGLVFTININLETGNNVTGAGNPLPKPLPALVADTRVKFRLTALEGRTAQTIADISAYDITIGIDRRNPKPENGHWILTDGAKQTLPIPAEASNDDVASAIDSSSIFPGGVKVRGYRGNWIVEAKLPGFLPPMGGVFGGTTATSKLAVRQLDSGSQETHAAYRVVIIQTPGVIVLPADWTLTEPAPASTLTAVSTSLYRIVPDRAAASGYYDLTINGKTIGGIRPDLSAFNLENHIARELGLGAITSALDVQSHPEGGYLIKLSEPLTLGTPSLTLDDSGLAVPAYWEASAEIDSEAIAELLEGSPYAESTLELRLDDPGSGDESAYLFPVVIHQPVIRDTPGDSAVTPGSGIRDAVSLYSPYTALWYPVTASLDGNGDPILEIGNGVSTPGLDPVIIKHVSSSELFTLHVGQGGGILITYYGDNALTTSPDLRLKLDNAEHVLVSAAGTINTISLNLTTHNTP